LSIYQRKAILILRVACVPTVECSSCTVVLPSEQAAAKPVNMNDKRRPRYQANSAEVRNFYRVTAIRPD
jgi:hypothetical protein